MTHSQPALSFPLLGRKPVQVNFTGGSLSSDGGLVLVAQLDRQIGLTERVAACIQDPRLPERVTHSLVDLIRQRVYQICAGYEDCNDADRLRSDPALKVSVGRAPHSGEDLASQPTLSRLEHTVAEAECEAVNAVLLEHFVSCPRKPPKEVVLDFDPSEDPTHGQQEFAFYNGYYGSRCYLPLFAFARAGGESEEFLVSADLPDTHVRDTDAILGTLGGLVRGIRGRWQDVKVVFRADAWFAVPEIYDWCEANRLSYGIAIPGNNVLHDLSRKWRERAEERAAASPAKMACCFGEFSYRAVGWARFRKVVAVAQVTPEGTNVRYVVVSGLRGSPRNRYQYYGRRGDCENRIKELKTAIKSDRTSCIEFASNKVRLMLHAVAYVLMQRLRRVARNTGLARAQVETLRLALIKIAAQIKESGRRVHVALCSTCPSQELWRLLARRIGVASR